MIGQCKFLIDTGATNSLVNPNVFHPSKIVNLKEIKKMSALNTLHNVSQKAIVRAFSEFKLPNEYFEFFVYRFNNEFEGLLGNDILRKFQAVIDYGRNCMIINKQVLPLFYGLKQTAQLELLPGKHYYAVPVPVQHGNMLINNILHSNDSIFIDEGLYNCENGKVVCGIGNMSGQSFVMSVDELLDLEEVLEVHHVEDLPVRGFRNAGDGMVSIFRDIRMDHLNHEERIQLNILIRDFKEVFSDEGKLSFTHEIKHAIVTKDDIAIKSKIYRYPYVHKDEIQRQILDMLQNGIISPSSSPYNSPVWIVSKKPDASGIKKFRLVIDYRKLNEKTIDDSYPIPNIVDILDKLGKSNYFSILDLKSGFHQIEVNERDRQKTAFSVDNGHYEFNRMPFGLKNAPSTFQRLMDNILRENVSKKECMVYMDDIIVFSNGLEEHIKNLRAVFFKLKRARLRVQLNKCEFLRKEVGFLGHIVNKDGVSPDRDKIKVINKIALPRTETEIKRFLGMTGYYRRFIENYAHIAKPMTMCLKKGNIVDIDDPKYIEAFKTLKEKLISAPILVYPDFSVPFEVTSDASNVAIGGVLSQNDKPIAYVSRTLNEHELNYSTIEKECLGMVWCLKQFRPYIYGRKIRLFTDHKPLVWLNGIKEPNSKLMRWRLQMGEYDYDINYKEGHLNKVADCLSRMEINNNEVDPVSSPSMSVDDSECTNAEMETRRPLNFFKRQIIFEKITSGAASIKNTVVYGKKRKIIKAKLFDGELIKSLLSNHFDREKVNAVYMDDEVFESLRTIKAEHFKEIKIIRCKIKLVDIVDEKNLEEIISVEHLRNNHRGINENYSNLKLKYYFPGLIKKITEFINNCEICMLEKYDRQPKVVPFMISETPRKPNDVIHMDVFYSIHKTLFVTMIDKFTKLALITRVKNRSDPEFRKAILRYISAYGGIGKIVTDNELGMKSAGMAEFLRERNIQLHFTSSLNHNSNSDVERLHNTINEHLRILKHTMRHIPIEEQMILINGYYNETIHGTTNIKPIDFVQGKINELQYDDIYQTILRKKEQRISKLNENRSDETPLSDGINYIKEIRGGKNHSRFRKIAACKIDENHLKDERSGQIYYRSSVKKRKRGQDPQKVKFPVVQTSKRGNSGNDVNRASS